jgi:hypothetical protein
VSAIASSPVVRMGLAPIVRSPQQCNGLHCASQHRDSHTIVRFYSKASDTFPLSSGAFFALVDHHHLKCVRSSQASRHFRGPEANVANEETSSVLSGYADIAILVRFSTACALPSTSSMHQPSSYRLVTRICIVGC